MAKGLEIPFDRVTWRDGQLLTANDMQSDQTRNSRLWQLHTRYLHDTWGIAIGFNVYADNGDSALQVGPGYAVDEQGRPLVSSETTAITVPLTPTSPYQVLVMNYQHDAAFRGRAGLGRLCLGGDAAVLQESPVFTWKSMDQVHLGADVPLITVQVANGQIQSTDTRVRRYVQKLMRPYIAAGQTDQGSTQWTPNSNTGVQGFALYQAGIDTTDSGFNNIPFYFPELHMWNQAPQSLYGATNGSADTDFVDFGGPYTYLTNPTSTGFTFNLLVPVADSGQPTVDPNLAQWTVSWSGIEVAVCEPPFHLLIAFISNFQRLFPIFRVVKL
jgi:hypothetical protein